MVGIPLTEAGNAILYLAPTTSTKLFAIKRPSFPKGVTPPQLKAFAGQVKAAPKACKGKKGQLYRECLIKESAGLKK